MLNGSEERPQYEAFVTTPKSKTFVLRGDIKAYYFFILNKTQFGTAYQSGNPLLRLTCIKEHEYKGCMSLRYWKQGQISSYI